MNDLLKYNSFADWKKANPKAAAAAQRKGWIRKIQQQFWKEGRSEFAEEVDKAVLKMFEHENNLLEEQIKLTSSINEKQDKKPQPDIESQPKNKDEENIESQTSFKNEVISLIWNDTFLKNIFRVRTYLDGTYVEKKSKNLQDFGLDVHRAKCDFSFTALDIIQTIEMWYHEEIECVGLSFYTKSKDREELISKAAEGVGRYVCMSIDESIGNCADEPTHSCLLILDLIPVKTVDKNLSYKENIIKQIKDKPGLMRFFGAYFLMDDYYFPESTHYEITAELIEKLIREKLNEEDGFAYAHIDLDREVTVQTVENGLDRLIHGMKFGNCEHLSDGEYYHSDYLHEHKYDMSEMLKRPSLLQIVK